jgi:hypothetical protein
MGNGVFWFLAIVSFVATIGLLLWPVRKILFASSRITIKEGKRDHFGKSFEKAFISCIHGCKRFIKIVAGECSPQAYTEPVGQALKNALARGVKIQVVCGPILLVRNGHSPILDLVKEENFELYVSHHKRMPLHYRVGDENHHVHWEEPHSYGAQIRYYHDCSGNAYENEDRLRDFDRLIASGKVRRTLNPSDDLVFVEVETQLEEIQELATKRGKDLEELDGKEICMLMADLKANTG